MSRNLGASVAVLLQSKEEKMGKKQNEGVAATHTPFTKGICCSGQGTCACGNDPVPKDVAWEGHDRKDLDQDCGLSFEKRAAMKVYLAGPMTNVPFKNFPEFDRVAGVLRNLRYEVISPAELDSQEIRDLAMKDTDGTGPYPAGESWASCLIRDLEIIVNGEVEAVVVLPDWDKSQGARLEVASARAMGLPIYTYPDMKAAVEPMMQDGPIKRALPLVHGDRQNVYGHPITDFTRTAGMWRALFGWDVEAKDIPLAMIAVKLSRLHQTPDHEDSQTDICGYAETYGMVMDALRGQQN